MKLDTRAPLSPHAPARVIDIRVLESQKDLHACVDLQRRTWGDDFAGIVPTSLLIVGTHIGGVAAGAFDGGGAMLGFVFGLTGVKRKTIVHWSHMLAVAPEAQNRGIGRRLKEFQRAAASKVGAKTIYWTFDPLVARNAHLNVNVLGVRVGDYVQDMYGESTSPLHRGIGTDRLVVSWPVDDKALATQRGEIAARLDAASDSVRIEIPVDIGALQASDMASARQWRERTRTSFQTLLASGYAIIGFRLDGGTAHYILSRNSRSS